MTAFWIILGLVALIVALPFAYLARLREPDPKTAPGQMAELPTGRTHYRWIGPLRGPVVVMIHGLTTPSPVFTALAEGLGRTGYRVLVYDLPGRGHSASRAGRQDRALFLNQLDALLAHEGLTGEITLVGYSMGGSIATAWAATHPERVTRLILLASAGIETEESRFEALTRRVPVIGDWLHAVAANARMTANLMGERGRPSEVPGIVEVQLEQLKRRGFLSAVLASRRGMLSERQEAEHRKLGHEAVPVIAFWGEEDSVVPLRALGTLAAWNRTARQEVIDGAGHGLPHTHASAVLEHLRLMLREEFGIG